jgi:hypothetical protein
VALDLRDVYARVVGARLVTQPRNRNVGLSLEEMDAAIVEIRGRYPRARLVKNMVGNLSVISEDGHYVGFIEINLGEVEWVDGD